MKSLLSKIKIIGFLAVFTTAAFGFVGVAFATYASSGTFTSSVINTGQASSFTTLDYTASTPANTTLTVDVRAGNVAVPDGTWTAWQTGIANGGSISALNGNQYVQYRANLATTDTAVTSSLSDITFNYSYSGTTLFANNSGQVGIGKTAPSYALDVLSSGTGIIARFNSANTTGCTLATGGTISCSSDSRLKKNIEAMSFGLSDFMNLNPITYNWKSEEDSITPSFGFIAQEVEKIFPKLVLEDSEGFKQLNTIGLIPILTNAIQELNLNLESIASLETPKPDSFADKFFVNLFIRIKDWMANAANGVEDFFAHRGTFNELCVEDVCVTRNQFLQMINQSDGNSSGGGSSSTNDPSVIASDSEAIPSEEEIEESIEATSAESSGGPTEELEDVILNESEGSQSPEGDSSASPQNDAEEQASQNDEEEIGESIEDDLGEGLSESAPEPEPEPVPVEEDSTP